jgi:hypothetical protein
MDDPAGLAATDSVDVLLKGGVSDQALLVWRHVVLVRAFARMPTSQNRDMGHPILWRLLDVGHPPEVFGGLAL